MEGRRGGGVRWTEVTARQGSAGALTAMVRALEMSGGWVNASLRERHKAVGARVTERPAEERQQAELRSRDGIHLGASSFSIAVLGHHLVAEIGSSHLHFPEELSFHTTLPGKAKDEKYDPSQSVHDLYCRRVEGKNTR